MTATNRIKVPIEVLESLTSNDFELMCNTNMKSGTLQPDNWISELATYYYNLGKKHAFNESMQTPVLFKRKD